MTVDGTPTSATLEPTENTAIAIVVVRVARRDPTRRISSVLCSTEQGRPEFIDHSPSTTWQIVWGSPIADKSDGGTGYHFRKVRQVLSLPLHRFEGFAARRFLDQDHRYKWKLSPSSKETV